MEIRQYAHPKYIQLFKNILAVFAFIYPAYLLLTSTSNDTLIIIIEVVLAFFMMAVMLVTAFVFQDIWIDDKGLLVEFLWRKIRVRWEDITEIKHAWGFWLVPEKNRPFVVLANGLTSFHRVIGVIYAFSIRPTFMIYPSISDFQILKENIQTHIKNEKQSRVKLSR